MNIMLAIRIARHYRDPHKQGGSLRCANLACKAMLEPPYNIHEFTVGQLPKTFRRPFCVNCADALERAGSEVIVEIY